MVLDSACTTLLAGQQGTLGNPTSVGLCQAQVLDTLSNVVKDKATR